MSFSSIFISSNITCALFWALIRIASNCVLPNPSNGCAVQQILLFPDANFSCENSFDQISTAERTTLSENHLESSSFIRRMYSKPKLNASCIEKNSLIQKSGFFNMKFTDCTIKQNPTLRYFN